MSKRFAIFAIHPIMYQTPIFKEFTEHIEENGIDIEMKVLFADDLSLKSNFFKEINAHYKPNVPFLLDGYNYKFLKNYAKDARGGFLSRINPGVFSELKNGNYNAILIHGYDNLSSWLTLLAAKITGTRVIYRGESVLRGNEASKRPKQLIKEIVLRFFFKSSHAVMYSCSGNKDYLSHYGVSESKMFPIPCAVNNEFFQAEAEKYAQVNSDVRTELNIPEDHLAILFSARFTSRKRPMDLLEAVNCIENENITILFVGDGPERKALEAYAKEKKINTVFTGFINQDQISKYYSVADLDIVISDYDPSPKAMNEAMNFKLPIISTDVVGTAEDLVQDGVNGYIIKVGDIQKLSGYINGLNKDRALVNKMGQASFDIVNRWNYEADVDGILAAFNYVNND